MVYTRGGQTAARGAKRGPPQRFQLPAEAFRTYVQITVNVSAEVNQDLLLQYFH